LSKRDHIVSMSESDNEDDTIEQINARTNLICNISKLLSSFFFVLCNAFDSRQFRKFGKSDWSWSFLIGIAFSNAYQQCLVKFLHLK
jgi:hypothetical protein